MSAKTKRIERGQRFRRAWRGENRARAVSPVVATLILILIAVAAAAALYLWLVVWQGNITGGIGSPHAQSTLTIGGSTSAYPFTSLATTWFEQNNSDVVVSDNQGGTGAGMIAVCSGNIDLGASSTPMSVSLLETDYGCASQYASTITITTIAYDAVDVIIPSANTHGLLSINWDTLVNIYAGGSTTTTGVHVPGYVNNVLISGTNIPVVTPGTPVDWNTIPAMAPGFTIAVGATSGWHWDDGGVVTATTGTLSDSLADTAVAAAGVACGDTTVIASMDDVCDGGAVTGATDTGTECGFVVCASGATAALPIERSDASGTTQTFEARLLGFGSGPSSSASAWASTTAGAIGPYSALGYGGCGGNNLLSDCGYTYPTAQQGNGNPGVLSAVASTPNGIGYASDGLARADSSVAIVPFLAVGEDAAGAVPVTTGSSYSYGGVVPTTGTTGTIAAGLTDNPLYNQYAGGRPFQLISLEPLSGTAQEFVTFITDPGNNAALALATDEVGLYSVVP